MTAPLVFVSKPGLLTPEQDSAQYRTMRALEVSGLTVLDLDRAQYSAIPWQQLRELIGRADGAVVLGFRQISVKTGTWRKGTVEAGPAAGWYPTAWNQLEAGLAVMAALPVLVMSEPGIDDGVFSPDVWGGDVYGLDPANVDRFPDLSQHVYGHWVEAVHQHAIRTCQPMRSKSRGTRRLDAVSHPSRHR